MSFDIGGFIVRTFTDPIAFFTLWLAVFTLVLAVVSIRQGAQIRREFVATFRPKLVIRELEYVHADVDKSEIRYTIVNKGGSPATIVTVNLASFTQSPRIPLPAVPTYDLPETFVKPIVLNPGTSARLTYDAVKPTERTAILPGFLPESLYFLGYMDYKDDNHIPRRIAFCRRYNAETRRFEVVDDPDYEYAD
jgi:hypothetical protein